MRLVLVALLGVLAVTPARAQDRAISIVADVQSADVNAGIVQADGNVVIRYTAEDVEATAQRATYYTREQRIVLEGDVTIRQRQNTVQAQTVTYLVLSGTIEAAPGGGQQVESVYFFPVDVQDE